MTRSLENRIGIVTGAAKGMGREICLALAGEGAHLALAAREAEPLLALGREIEAVGRRTLVQPTDVTDEAAVSALVERTLATFGGRIDILVNGAGVTGPIETPVWEIKSEDWDHVLAVNLRGTFLPTKHVLPPMIAQRYGKIINISGTSGLRGYKNRAAYSSSKWAPRGFSPERIHDEYVQEMALRRVTTARDIANAVVFLASDASKNMTGQSMTVDGGWDV